MRSRSSSSSGVIVSERRNCPARRPIVIVGFMAAGKTVVGRRLAAYLGMSFLDTDREIERTFGCSVAEIFERHGESAFRTAECELIARLLGDGTKVVSAGGGVFCDGRLRSTINTVATSIWLDPAFDLILDRLASSSERPLASARSADELRRLWRERRQSYAEAHIHVEISPDLGIDTVIERIVRDLPHRQRDGAC